MFRRKWLASVVSVVMVFAFMPISSFALDDFGVQPAENTEVSVPDAEPAADSDTEATVEDEQAAEPAPVEETTEDVSEESEQQETESAEEVKDIPMILQRCLHRNSAVQRQTASRCLSALLRGRSLKVPK